VKTLREHRGFYTTSRGTTLPWFIATLLLSFLLVCLLLPVRDVDILRSSRSVGFRIEPRHPAHASGVRPASFADASLGAVEWTANVPRDSQGTVKGQSRESSTVPRGGKAGRSLNPGS